MARATRDKWAKRVEAWKQSGLSIERYAAKAGLNARSLAWWKWHLASKPSRRSPTPSISPLTFVEVKASEAAAGLEVVLASGVSVRVPVDFDSVVLGRLLDVLERRK